MPDRLKTWKVDFGGGLITNTSPLAVATQTPGAAIKLVNFESDTRGGYSRINGYTKWDTTVVPGEGKVLGVDVVSGTVYAARKAAGSNQYGIYYGVGSGWTALSTGRAYSSVTTYRVRTCVFNWTGETIIFVDGTNRALRWKAGASTLISGTGAPANPKYVAEYRYSLFLAGYSSNTAAISFSVPNDETNWAAASGAGEIVVGDEVLALVPHRDSLYIFCRSSIKRLTGTSKADYKLENVTDRLGLFAEDSVVEISGDLVFCSFDGIRPLSQTERIDDVNLATISLQVQDRVRAMISAYTRQEFIAVPIRNKNQYRLFVSSENITREVTPGILGVLRNNTQGLAWEWSDIVGIKPSCGAARSYLNQEVVVHGDFDGFVHRHDFGNSFDGNGVSFSFQTPWYDNGDTTMRKTLHKLDVYYRVNGLCSFNIQTVFDYGRSNVILPTANTVETASAFLAIYSSLTSLYGTAIYGATDAPIDMKNLIGSGLTYGFVVSGTTTAAPFTLQSFVIQYADKGKR
jgi:hypothetical protein